MEGRPTSSEKAADECAGPTLQPRSRPLASWPTFSHCVRGPALAVDWIGPGVLLQGRHLPRLSCERVRIVAAVIFARHAESHGFRPSCTTRERMPNTARYLLSLLSLIKTDQFYRRCARSYRSGSISIFDSDSGWVQLRDFARSTASFRLPHRTPQSTLKYCAPLEESDTPRGPLLRSSARNYFLQIEQRAWSPSSLLQARTRPSSLAPAQYSPLREFTRFLSGRMTWPPSTSLVFRCEQQRPGTTINA